MAENIKYRFIQNVGDYFPSGYFSEDFLDKVKKTSGLSEEEMVALCKPYVQLRRDYEAYKNYIVNAHPRVKDAIKHTHDFNSRLMTILGYSKDTPYEFYEIDEDAQSFVPVRQVLHRGNNTSMLVMEMQHLIPIGDEQPSGLFEQRYDIEGEEKTVRHQQYYAGQWSEVFEVPADKRIFPAVINKAIDALFLLPPERRPHYILMMAGNTLFLLDAQKWNRGAYLQFSLDELFSLANTSVREYRLYYALFHLLACKETLAADSETVLMDKLVEESYKSAYEVTKDLKDGVILSVETLANEALYWWKQNNNLPISDYTDDTFEAQVKDDCLTIIYRLLFIFYAESRDDLDILPTNDEVYNQGYSLEMLRDLEKVPLISEASRNGFFIHESLQKLFYLLSAGFHENKVMGDKTFSVRHIDSPLFDNSRLKHLGDVKFRNIAWQEIIKALSLSHRDRQVGRISYANLGVNQLGSVYESLLAYRGFYAEGKYIEVHQAGSNSTDDTYLVPYSRMDDFKGNEILHDSEGQIIIHERGKFLYRLNGRDRQKSASYYTPEVLTRSTVKYTLKAIIDEVAEGKRKASELLDLKILEPAMGAAAFQNEVINQLAEAYLVYQQQQKKAAGCSTWRISPDHYRDELQKVKAYIATHNVYGVDLNPTAIELGKLSLWLNVIHKDMETPFFSNRLALGNAVIGAWLKVYSKDEIYGKKVSGKKKLQQNPWWEKAPHTVKFFKTKVNRSANEVYHFLLPDKNMLAVRKIREQQQLHPAEHKAMTDIITKDWTEAIGGDEFKILQRLSAKIDVLLKEYFEFQQSIEKLTQNKMALWGTKGNMEGEMFIAEKYKVKEQLNDARYRHDNAYFRLKMVMDYWCALWFWDYDKAKDLPTREEYWSDIDAMLDVSNEALDAKTVKALNLYADTDGQISMFPEGTANDFATRQKLDEIAKKHMSIYAQKEEESEIKRLSKEEILQETQGKVRGFFDDSKRFKIVMEYADRYHFFHPMLEFLEVFWLRGGFDIICGNPPWIKLEFDESGIISEKYPEVVIRKTSAPQVREMKDKMFAESPALKELYFAEEQENTCTGIFLNAKCSYPLLERQQVNLYKCILTNGFSMLSDKGYMGLLHPESIYDDAHGQPLRREVYPRLRYHFQFVNELSLFAEVDHNTKYGEHIYGAKQDQVDFLSIHNLYHPNTIDACFVHNGSGICGGLKTEDNRWNTEAHLDRIVHFTERELKILSETFEGGADWQSVKLTSIHANIIINVLEKLSKFPKHVRDYSEKIITASINETKGADEGLIERKTTKPSGDYDVIISGPHFYVSTPFYKEPYENYRVNNDYDVISLATLPDTFVPRTVLSVPKPHSKEYLEHVKGFIIGQDEYGHNIYDRWIDYYKFAYRCMLGLGSEYTFIGCLLPPKWNHIHAVNSIIFKDTCLLIEFSSLCSSVVFNFLSKVIGSGNLLPNRLQTFPLGIADKYKSSLFVRTLLLNCLSTAYSDLWSEMWHDDYSQDSWSKEDSRLKPFNSLTHQWEWATPLRNALERRQALVEIDVITAMALGLSLEDLETIYTIQLSILQKNEKDTWYDAEGKIVYTCSAGLGGVGLSRPQWEAMRGEQSEDGMTYKGLSPTYIHTIDPAKSRLYGGQQQTFIAPYTRCDRIADYRRAWAHFEKRFKE